MRRINALLCGWLLLACSWASEWKHDLLLSGASFIGGTRYNNVLREFSVNPSGVSDYFVELPGLGFQAYRYKTNLNQVFLGSGSQGQTGGINSLAQAGYSARDSQGFQHVMVEDHDFYEDVFAPNRDPSLTIQVGGVDAQGRAFWTRRYQGQHGIFLGADNLAGTEVVNSPNMSQLNQNGDCVWSAFTSDSGAGTDVFKNHSNISRDLLGSSRRAGFYPVMNSLGDILWSGSGTITGLQSRLFLNSVDLTGNRTNLHNISTLGLSDDGHYLWSTQDASFKAHLLYDQTDLGEAVFGSMPYEVGLSQGILGERGDILWAALDQTANKTVLFHGLEDISTPVTGGLTTQGLFFGLDRNGNAAWSGGGPLTGGKLEVFVNQFCLSKDALSGEGYLLAGTLAQGVNGQVLWYSLKQGGSISVYLSSPVPEPDTIWLLVFVSLVQARRILQRANRSSIP